MATGLVIKGCPGETSPGPFWSEPRPIAFLDRDGVLNVDRGYVATLDRFEWTATAFETVALLVDRGYAVAVVTNQSGIGRGLYQESDFLKLTDWMLAELPAVTVVAYCPHGPEAGCPGRKPGTGQLEAVGRVCPCLREESFLVGDKDSDLEAAARFGIPGFRPDADGPLGAVTDFLRSKGTA